MNFMLITAIITLLTGPNLSSAECVPARETIRFPHSGLYHRVHPSGNYVLYSNNGVKIVDISNRTEPKAINTPMRSETYPVEGASGGWDLVASPYDVGGMNYYQFKDVLEKSESAASVYRDPQNDQYYHSSAELPGSTASEKKVRTLLFGQTYREYTMRKDAQGNFTRVEAGPAGQRLCQEILPAKNPKLDFSLNARDARRVSELTARFHEMTPSMLGMSSYSNNGSFSPPSGGKAPTTSPLGMGMGTASAPPARSMEEIRAETNARQAEYNAIHDEMATYYLGSKAHALIMRQMEILTDMNRNGSPNQAALEKELARVQKEIELYQLSVTAFNNPVLSKDGTLVAAADSSDNVSVYKILPGSKCQRIANTKFAASKVSFSYPQPGKLPKITFTTEGGPTNGYRVDSYIYDLNTKKSQVISNKEPTSRYPGFTRDGRVIYSSGEGFTIVDPNQVSGKNPRTCIQKSARASQNSPSGEATGNGTSAE